MKNSFWGAMAPVICAIAFIFSPNSFGSEARILRLDEKKVATVRVQPGRTTVLSFPTKHTKVILGSKGLFAVEYVESDVAVSALTATSASNLFVYMEGRRFAFDLVSVARSGDEIILVRDILQTKVKVK